VPSSWARTVRHLLAGKDHGEALWLLGADHVFEPAQLDAQHLAVEKEQGAEGLVLRRGAGVALHREGGEEVGHLLFAHLPRVALVVEEDVAPDPVAVRLLGAAAQVADADRLVELSEEPGAGAGRWSRLGDEPRDAAVIPDPSQRVCGVHSTPPSSALIQRRRREGPCQSVGGDLKRDEPARVLFGLVGRPPSPWPSPGGRGRGAGRIR
jgi:hypothetical protein